MIVSPLTNSEKVTLLKTFNTDQLIGDWKNDFNIDISEALHHYKEIYLYQCSESKLKFFVPLDISGSDKLYEQLEKFDWYYMPRKWEHDVAIKDLIECINVLEVGCGRGAFVHRLCQEEKIDAQGIELNSSAVQYGERAGIPIFQKNVHELAKYQANSFDAVCTFQVLEHISDFLLFLESMICLLKPKGKLIISVPNSLSFTQYCKNNLLDQPPHHITQWSEESFKFLATKFDLKIKHFKIEPLAEYHLDWYLSVHLSRLPKIKFVQSVAYRIFYTFFKPILKLPQVRSLISGHTLYVCFEKR